MQSIRFIFGLQHFLMEMSARDASSTLLDLTAAV